MHHGIWLAQRIFDHLRRLRCERKAASETEWARAQVLRRGRGRRRTPVMLSLSKHLVRQIDG
jgi:hypothetical protein